MGKIQCPICNISVDKNVKINCAVCMNCNQKMHFECLYDEINKKIKDMQTKGQEVLLHLLTFQTPIFI